MCWSRVAASAPNGIRSSSWKVMPYAPSSASRCTASTGSSAGRVASPNGSRACQPTVQSPKENLSAGVGRGAMTDLRGGGELSAICLVVELFARRVALSRGAAAPDAPAGAVRQGSLRELNLALVLRPDRRRRPARRPGPTLAAATGLTRATVSALVDDLIAGRLVTEVDPRPGPAPAGRPRGLVLAGHGPAGLGLEVNVDYLAACVVDLTGAVRHRAVRPGRPAPGRARRRAGRAWSSWPAQARAAAAGQGLTLAGAALAVPGLVDDAGLVRLAPNLGWRDVRRAGAARRAPAADRPVPGVPPWWWTTRPTWPPSASCTPVPAGPASFLLRLRRDRHRRGDRARRGAVPRRPRLERRDRALPGPPGRAGRAAAARAAAWSSTPARRRSWPPPGWPGRNCPPTPRRPAGRAGRGRRPGRAARRCATPARRSGSPWPAWSTCWTWTPSCSAADTPRWRPGCALRCSPRSPAGCSPPPGPRSRSGRRPSGRRRPRWAPPGRWSARIVARPAGWLARSG